MAYVAWSVVFGEQPSAAKWNQLGTNDASFNDGTGLADGAVTPAKRTGGFKIGTIASATLNSTGDKSITGVGFTPKFVEFRMIYPSDGSRVIMGYGAADGTSQFFTMSHATSGSALVTYTTTSYCIGYTGSGGVSPTLRAKLKSFDSDGFTIKVDNASGQDFAYIAYG